MNWEKRQRDQKRLAKKNNRCKGEEQGRRHHQKMPLLSRNNNLLMKMARNKVSQSGVLGSEVMMREIDNPMKHIQIKIS